MRLVDAVSVYGLGLGLGLGFLIRVYGPGLGFRISVWGLGFGFGVYRHGLVPLLCVWSMQLGEGLRVRGLGF